ncbi:uncharacterized protein PHACADRAFT_190538 [Phanerochaete carnosa HHB-10118-sp]|uniref:Enoyl reductase (ER) domain-containing protein n=1 Tax=Phanerochaete carnosa (strain HHB-10118-sp) TaxID=650164 RepID=K5XEB1_PHACS|nr:uncharacterized protein PHACADRAFT_190538 [Phanerochaete carnosa HHB-10118-sp]EKM61377.1 hypothetical protein PHACADRAFT_190538 [Phanerochaete carnosa HHB-10118-sp]
MSSVTTRTMTAYRFVPSKHNPVPEIIPVPIPTEGQVLVRVLAAGVCHSDVGILIPGGALSHFVPPTIFTLGHEGAGIIAELGPSVASTFPQLKIGDYVAIWSGNPCQKPTCIACSRGYTNLCTIEHGIHGLRHDGSWAEYIALRASSVVPVPGTLDGIAPAIISAATDAVLTPYHAMKTSCRVQAEHTVLCMGIGGLGLNGVDIAKKCLGARCVIACDTRSVALHDALAAGADYAVPPEQLLSLIEEERLVVDFAFDFVGIQATFDACFAAIRPGGTIHVLGLLADTLAYTALTAMRKDLTLKSSFWGTRDELAEILQAISDGLLKPKVDSRPMSQCIQVLDDMREGRLQARVALVPDAIAVRIASYKL